MCFTEEQKRRIEENRQKALEIRRRKALEVEESLKPNNTTVTTTTTTINPYETSKRPKHTHDKKNKPSKALPKNKTPEKPSSSVSSGEIEIEEFEIDLPTTCTKSEAQQIYCLPKGTIDVCTYIEKPNPRSKKFVPMKLYDRNDIRRRAHERYGGIDGLKMERKKRSDRRLALDLNVANDFFSGKL